MSARLAPTPDLPSVLIVDDSAVARAVIARAIESGGRLRVAETVASARAALAYLVRHSVAAVVLDVEMPHVDGLTALPHLMSVSVGTPILIVSSGCEAGAESTLRALALGAADTLVKPAGGRFASDFARILEERIARLVDAAEHPPSVTVSAGSAISDFDLVAIGASTGGIHALSQILGALDAEVCQPIVITQHLPESFMPHFAKQVALLARRPCSVATESCRLESGRVLIAPGDAHLRIVKTRDGAAVRLTHERMPSGCRPSVDPMLATAADVYGRRMLAIVLSGMGRDGAIGAQKVSAAGGSVVVQDKESSVIWGMPGAIATAGHADVVLPPDAIGRLVATGRRPC